MAEEKKTCAQCGAEIVSGDVCPSCGMEQPVAWMVYLAYGLIALFILGVIYRLIWP